MTVSLPYYNSPDFTPVWFMHPDDRRINSIHTIGDFTLTDQNNQTITQQTVEGKIHVANFFYSTCTGICPMMQANFESLQDTFQPDDDIIFLSYSVTPLIDSVERLKEYAAMHHVHSDKWHLLTGNREAIYSLARTSYFAEKEIGLSKNEGEFLHTEHILLVDKHLHIRGIYNGTLALEMQRLVSDIRLLQRED